MSMTVIVSLILILIVLAVLLIFFREEIGKLISNITGITEGIGESAIDVNELAG